MQLEAGMPFQPRLDARMFVRAVVVDDQMQRQLGWCCRIDALQEADEFLMPVARHTVADDLAIEHAERGKQRGGALRL